MTIIKQIFNLALLLSLYTLPISTWGQYDLNPPETWHYAIEINDVLCGFSESRLTSVEKEGKILWQLNDEILVRQSVLGGGVDLKINNSILIDPISQRPISIERLISTTADIYVYSLFEKDKVLYRSEKESPLKEFELTSDVIIENTLVYPHLLEDFIKGSETEKSYQVYDDMRSTIVEKKYKKIGEEQLELAGNTYNAIILDEFNMLMGTSTRMWLDQKNSYVLKIDIQNRLIYLSDKSARKRIKVVDMDNVLFAKVGEMIPNVPEISYMKVEAKIQSAGELISEEHLSFPGQKFTGTVTDNFVDGVFEIEPVLYSGDGVPAFPQKPEEKSMKKYLEPENLIESNNPVLIAEAKKITEGAADSWEAAVRLSKWVAENIKGAVPGGTSAINTYNTREGECGSHSRLLAAFCRAIGIPARLSIGCMYSPYLGGSFGQHAWTEVYMGEAGWIAVDATAFEYDYVDAGHIRLGESSSFNPKEMKILEYKLKGQDIQQADTIPSDLIKYTGKFLLEGANKVFEVKYQSGSLAVDIPGQTVLALNDPDEHGVFYPKMTRQINFSFIEDEGGRISTMKLQQLVPLQKRSDLEEVPEDVPEDILPLLGKYWLAQVQAEFTVFYSEKGLVVYDPMSKSNIALSKSKDTEKWTDEFGKNDVVFEKNAEGKITGLVIYSNVFLKKQE